METTKKTSIIIAQDGVTKLVQIETISPAVAQSSAFSTQTKEQVAERNVNLNNLIKSAQVELNKKQAEIDAYNAELKNNLDLISQL